MMDATDMLRILGPATVASVEQAVASAFAAAERHDTPGEGAAAVNTLLVLMLASAIITPARGAERRAKILTGQIVDIVSEALAMSSPQLQRHVA
ncbi:MAG: hypothetical protein ABL907_24035 [Hyphomicrobium sp.]